MIDWHFLKKVLAISMFVALPVEAVETKNSRNLYDIQREKYEKNHEALKSRDYGEYKDHKNSNKAHREHKHDGKRYKKHKKHNIKQNNIKYYVKNKKHHTEEDLKDSFYFKGFYNAYYVGDNLFKDAGSKATPVTKDADGKILDGSISEKYNPQYDLGLLGGGIAIGYMTDSGLGFEFEGICSAEVKVKSSNDDKKYFYYLQNTDVNDRNEPDGSQAASGSAMGEIQTKLDSTKDAVKALYTAAGSNGLVSVQTLLGASIAGDTGALTISPGSGGPTPTYTNSVTGPINGELKLNKLQNNMVISNQEALDTKVEEVFNTISAPADLGSVKEKIKELYSAADSNGIKSVTSLFGTQLDDGTSTLTVETGTSGPVAYTGSAGTSTATPELKLNDLQDYIVINDASALNTAIDNAFSTLAPASGATQEELDGVKQAIKDLYSTEGNNIVNVSDVTILQLFNDTCRDTGEQPYTWISCGPGLGDPGIFLIKDVNVLNGAVDQQFSTLSPTEEPTQSVIDDAKAAVKSLYTADAVGSNGITNIKTLITSPISGSDVSLTVSPGDAEKSPEYVTSSSTIPANGTLELNDLATKLVIDDKGALDQAVDVVFQELEQQSGKSPRDEVTDAEDDIKALYAAEDSTNGVVATPTFLGETIGALSISAGEDATVDPEYVVDPASVTVASTLELNDIKDNLVIQDKGTLDAAVDSAFADLYDLVAVAPPEEGEGKNSGKKSDNPADSASNPPKARDESDTGNPLAKTAIPIKYINNGFKYTAGMFNMYYSMLIGDGMFNPYIAGGIGLARVSIKGFNDEESKSFPFAVQGKVGATFHFNKSIIPYFGYRLLYLAETDCLSPMSSSKINVDGKKYADAALDKTSDTALDPNTYALGKYNEKIHNSYLLHSIELGLVVPFRP